MKKRVLATLLTAAMAMSLFAGCGGGQTKKTDEAANTPAETEKTEETGEGSGEVLTFYHAYYHDEATWPAAVVMRDIYQKFADEHANDACTFKAVPVEDVMEIATNEIAGGSFPDMVDFAGGEIPLAALSQNLVYDMKDYIDSEGIQSKVGINYTMNDKEGAIYSVHDQLLTLGLWYNADVYKAAGAATPDTWNNYEDMSASMEAIKAYGAADGIYAYSAGQGSSRLFNNCMALADKEAVENPLTADVINSDAFANTFKTVAAMDQSNGSANATTDVGEFSGDFNSGLCATFLNGVWGASGFGDAAFDVEPAVYPGSVSISSPGAGLTIASGLSDAQTKLALEFVKYMTSDEVQTKIFSEVQANPCNTDIDLQAIADETGDANVKLLAKACVMANDATTKVPQIASTWGADIDTAIINKLIECTVSGTDIDAKCTELQSELIGIIG